VALVCRRIVPISAFHFVYVIRDAFQALAVPSNGGVWAVLDLRSSRVEIQRPEVLVSEIGATFGRLR